MGNNKMLMLLLYPCCFVSLVNKTTAHEEDWLKELWLLQKSGKK
jgi:hypothetical protein